MILLGQLGPVREEGSDEPGPVQVECFYVNLLSFLFTRFLQNVILFSLLTLKICCQLHTLDQAPGSASFNATDT